MSRQIRTLMLGWEFPPFISGGLGTACYGLTKAMDRLGMEVIFMLPHSEPLRFGHTCDFAFDNPEEESAEGFEHVRFLPIESNLMPYMSAGQTRDIAGHLLLPEQMEALRGESSNSSLMSFTRSCAYGSDLFKSVYDYALRTVRLAKREKFDVIHAHDWMTYPAAAAIATASRKPLIAHVHSTEFDRSGDNVNSHICRIEHHGLTASKKIIAVSRYTKDMISRKYKIPHEKIHVVYNGVEQSTAACQAAPVRRYPKNKYVLYLGRVTMQKGPEYFLYAARMVLDHMDDVRFVMAGTGDMLNRMVELSAKLRIGSKVLFTKFLHGPDVQRAYRLADLYVMPSVSEPFGIAPLEAMRHNVPVLISKQSGVSEILNHALKCEFWDIHQMANKIISVLSRPALKETLCREGIREAGKFQWEKSARQIRDLYHQVV